MGNVADAMGRTEIKIIDREGVERVLIPLTINDFIELENTIAPLERWAEVGTKLDSWVFVVWLAMRKAGLTKEEIRAKKWKILREDVGEMFDASHVKQLGAVVKDLFLNSGMRTTSPDEPATGDTSPPGPKAPTG